MTTEGANPGVSSWGPNNLPIWGVAPSNHLETLYLRAAGHVYTAALRAGHILEYARPISDILQFGHRVQDTAHPRPWVIEQDPDQAVGLGKRKRAQQHRIHDAENRRVGSDSQGQGLRTATTAKVGFFRSMRTA